MSNLKVGERCPNCGQKKLRFTPAVRALIIGGCLYAMFMIGAVLGRVWQ